MLLNISLLSTLGCLSPDKDDQSPTDTVNDTGLELDTGDTASETDTDTQDTDTQDTDTQDTNPDTGTQDTGPIQEDGPVLFFEDEFQVGGTNMWSNLWPTNDGFYFSTMQNEQVAFREFNLDFQPTSDLKMVTELGDFPPGVVMSDHEFLRLNNALYFVASGFGDEDLIIIKTDLNGTRLGNYTIQEGLPIACNDPHLLLVDENICVRWGTSGPDKSIQCFDEGLTPLGSSFGITLPEPIPQLGYSMQVGSEIWSFTGDAPQRDLIISRYDLDWNPLTPFSNIILESENDDWNWFPGGVVHHEELGLWFVTYTYMEDGQEANFDSIVKLAAFDENFTLLDNKTLSGNGYTRPNLALIGDQLVVSYDNGNLVWLERWSIQAPQ